MRVLLLVFFIAFFHKTACQDDDDDDENDDDIEEEDKDGNQKGKSQCKSPDQDSKGIVKQMNECRMKKKKSKTERRSVHEPLKEMGKLLGSIYEGVVGSAHILPKALKEVGNVLESKLPPIGNKKKKKALELNLIEVIPPFDDHNLL